MIIVFLCDLGKMPRGKYPVFHLMLLSGAICAAVGDDLFGMRLTTETLKTKERTHYRFHYFVKDDTTGDYKTQEEVKEGDSVHGSYTLAEPNGDLRTVTYKAGPGTGFEAKVDIQPSASPMKPTTEGITPSPDTPAPESKTVTGAKTDSATTLTPEGKPLPGGVLINVLKKPQTQQNHTGKTEIPMSTTLTPEGEHPPGGVLINVLKNPQIQQNHTGKTEIPMSTTLTPEGKPLPGGVLINVLKNPQNQQNHTGKTEIPMLTDSEGVTTAAEEKTTTGNTSTPLTASPEGTAISEPTEDPIQKKIDDVENSMPKLPEIVLADNKTHLKFYKDPEEALLDERITQIARQLAETGLRREYEERKLGHFIPISVTAVEPSTPGHLSKSFKFTRDDPPNFRPIQQLPLPMLTRVKLVPQYIYKEAVLPRFLAANQRLPVLQTTLPFQEGDRWEQQTYETVTNIPEIMRINRSKPQLEEINKILGMNEAKYSTNYNTLEPVSVVPIQAPTFLQFFSPYLVPTQGNYIPVQTKTQAQFQVTPVSLPSSTMADTEQKATKS